MIEIIGEKIKLKPIDFTHTNKILQWRNHPEVVKNFLYQEKITLKDHEKWMREKVKTGEVIQFIIYEKEEGREIGSVYFRDIDWEERKAEYGIFIGEDWARGGKGYGTETAKKMVEYAFCQLRLHKIYLRVIDTNERAIRSYKRAGFVKIENKKEEVFLKDGPHEVMFMEAINPYYSKELKI
ncbi:N-acetyltransferase [bacterium 1XD42-8]|jgi:UDP-4-amino-4,6-dideoxy-N-acetyl-beta-L-altrosamine N-acetyltransferase|nr:GNAT family N-acetyltransferase [Lachnospiraceae bacterium]RKJ50476.1 N-acetyltransferase [bacterium 1XD42-8]